MKTKQQVKDKLDRALKALELDGIEVRTELENGHRLVAVVTTPEFEGEDEAERQSRVWEVVYDELDEDEQVMVDFIFTNTPKEEEEIEQEEQKGEQS